MKLQTIFAVAAALLLTVVLADASFAATATGAAGAGNTALSTLTGAITGNIGLLIGLGLAVGGLWTWIVGQNTAAGLTMIAGGILLTLSPGIFNGMSRIVAPVVNTFSGSNTDTVTRNTTGN